MPALTSKPTKKDWSGGPQWGLGPNPSGPSMSQVNENTPVVGSRPPGSIVGSYGASGTTYVDPKTGAIMGIKPPPARANQPTQQAQMVGGGFSGGGSGGGGYGGGQASPVEFYLGPAPTIPQLKLPGAPTIPNLQLPGAPQLSGLDYSGVMDQFRSTFNMLNTGVNPQFGVDVGKIAADAREVASKLNLSPSQIKDLVASINPTTGEIVADVESIAGKLNSPQKIAEIGAQAEKLASGLNSKYQAAFNSAMPGYMANMAKANATTSELLAGKIPQDVVDSIYRGAAAKGFTAGIFGGGIGRNIVAKDLGLTSLQLQSAGANLLQQTAQVANSVLQATMPVSGESFVSTLAAKTLTDPNQIFSSVMNMNRVDPTSVFNAVYTPNRQVFEQMSNMAQQSTMARATFEASKMISPGTVFDTLTKQAQYNQQINMQNMLNSWETAKTMAVQNNQIAEKNALNQWQAKLAEAQYNQQIDAQNAINAWQSKALPGQFDISKGQFVSYTPGQYQSTRPTIPGEPASASGDGRIRFGRIDAANMADFRAQAERNYFRNYRV